MVIEWLRALAYRATRNSKLILSEMSFLNGCAAGDTRLLAHYKVPVPGHNWAWSRYDHTLKRNKQSVLSLRFCQAVRDDNKIDLWGSHDPYYGCIFRRLECGRRPISVNSASLVRVGTS